MTLRARAGKCGSVAERPSSASSADRATAPNPLAQRSSMSRRVRGVGMKRPQCMNHCSHLGDLPVDDSVYEDKFLDVEQHMSEIRPGVGFPCWRFGLVIEKIHTGRQFGFRRWTREGTFIHTNDPLVGRAGLSQHAL